ncbi:MAG: hypothetical protein A4S09_04625 [Proteobacteria bacterium SG_bin7]|nr:MAG: hypothetical protein A4S09_04625 [Proteobacteria bacterium SG_bin7]
MTLGDFKINKDKINKLKNELLKYNSIDAVKTEVTRLANDFRKVDLQSKLSERNKERVRKIETRYNEVVKTIAKIQKQLDKEISQVISLFQKSRTEAKQKFSDVKKRAESHKENISKKIKTTLKKQKKGKK